MRAGSLHSCQIGAGCWLGALVPFDVGPSTGMFECPHDMASGFPRVNDPRDQDGSCDAFYDLALEATHCHFHCI